MSIHVSAAGKIWSILVDAAHTQGLHVILDIVLNHSGTNWIYSNGEPPLIPPYSLSGELYQKGDWFDRSGGRVSTIAPEASGLLAYGRANCRSDGPTRVQARGSGANDFAAMRTKPIFAARIFSTAAAISISTIRKSSVISLVAINIGSP